MKTMLFDGKEFAGKKERKLNAKVRDFNRRGVKPKLVTFLVGNIPASVLYTNLKKKAAERVGIEFEIVKFQSSVPPKKLIGLIKKLNQDESVHGIMVQLPLPKKIANFKLLITNSIARSKDVDGLREKSDFVPATVKAAIQIIEVAKKKLKHDFDQVVVVGAGGMVGKPLVKLLKTLNYKVKGVDIGTKNVSEITKKADLLISVTGVPGLIKESMVKDGVAIIDVGSPKGDVDPAVYKLASFYTPVPGGVGPVTIVLLLENLLIASGSKL